MSLCLPSCSCYLQPWCSPWAVVPRGKQGKLHPRRRRSPVRMCHHHTEQMAHHHSSPGPAWLRKQDEPGNGHHQDAASITRLQGTGTVECRGRRFSSTPKKKYLSLIHQQLQLPQMHASTRGGVGGGPGEAGSESRAQGLLRNALKTLDHQEKTPLQREQAAVVPPAPCTSSWGEAVAPGQTRC